MVTRRLAFLGAAVCLSASYMFVGARPTPCGQKVSDADAAKIRGGVCQSLATANCPNPGKTGCSACTKVVSGSIYGQGSGDCYCSGSCGSFFSSIVKCTN
jgi:hypothetical protein